jgi:DNA mismatch endonuclease, patch repair protein
MAKLRRSTHGRTTPSFKTLHSASDVATERARRASQKEGTRCEIQLKLKLQQLDISFRVNVSTLPGCPDFVFDEARLVVFADGDFWHGRNLPARLARLERGHNCEYWVKKLLCNVARDRRVNRQLRGIGWSVMRVWEGDIKRNPAQIALRIGRKIRRRTGKCEERPQVTN